MPQRLRSLLPRLCVGQRTGNIAPGAGDPDAAARRRAPRLPPGSRGRRGDRRQRLEPRPVLLPIPVRCWRTRRARCIPSGLTPAAVSVRIPPPPAKLRSLRWRWGRRCDPAGRGAPVFTRPARPRLMGGLACGRSARSPIQPQSGAAPRIETPDAEAGLARQRGLRRRAAGPDHDGRAADHGGCRDRGAGRDRCDRCRRSRGRRLVSASIKPDSGRCRAGGAGAAAGA